ncbi:MAG: hypothetical protein GY789_03690 [Hyphomicrobiales bacterium]|nr:hypothetical protein [Hyphomicrobiales bacterium]MCP4997247.1 hypothetical protein [Hyphomicrobiales bacterium]
MKDTLGIVVNFYCSQDTGPAREILVDATSLSLRLLRANADVDDIILVDGSENADSNLKSRCDSINVSYFHFGKKIGYSEAYNIG